MKNKSLLLILLVIAVLSLTACGSMQKASGTGER